MPEEIGRAARDQADLRVIFGELSSGMQWRMNAGLDFIAEKAIKIERASERSSMKSTRDASSLLAQRWLSDWKGALSLRWATFRRAEVRR